MSKSLHEQIQEGRMMSRKNTRLNPDYKHAKTHEENEEDYYEYLSAKEAMKEKRIEKIQSLLNAKRGLRRHVQVDEEEE